MGPRLGVTSILLFLLVTAHVALSLRDLLEAFIYVPTPAPPFYNSIYWIGDTTPTQITKVLLYDCAVCIQNVILIWRLYVVWNRNRVLIMIAAVLELAHVAVSFAVTALGTPARADLYSGTIKNMGTASWSLDLAINVSVTVAIAGRLCYMGKKVSCMSATRRASASITQNAYLAAVFTVAESGGIFAAFTLLMLVLFSLRSPLSLCFINIAVQLAALTPLLIIVRVGLGFTHGLPAAYKSYLITQGRSMTFASSSQIPGCDNQTIPTIDQSCEAGSITNSTSGPRDFVLRDFKSVDGLNSAFKGEAALVGTNEV